MAEELLSSTSVKSRIQKLGRGKPLQKSPDGTRNSPAVVMAAEVVEESGATNKVVEFQLALERGICRPQAEIERSRPDKTNCKFNHGHIRKIQGVNERGNFNQAGVTDCKYYMTSGCKYGKQCRFSHGSDKSSKSPVDFNCLPIRQNLPSMPPSTHGSRVVSCFLGHDIVFSNDTRTTKDSRRSSGPILIESNDMSKSHYFGNGVLGAYVGDVDLWKMALDELHRLCPDLDVKVTKENEQAVKTNVKVKRKTKDKDNKKGKMKEKNRKEKVEKKELPDIEYLSRELFKYLKKVPVGDKCQGIVILLGQHKDSKPKIVRTVVNFGPTHEDDLPQGVLPFVPAASMVFMSLGADYRSTDEYLRDISQPVDDWDFPTLSVTLELGFVKSILRQPCIGGTFEMLQMDLHGRIKKTNVPLLKLYLHHFDEFADVHVLFVFFPIKLAKVPYTDIYSRFGESRNSFLQYFGKLEAKEGNYEQKMVGDLDVYGVVFQTIEEARNAFGYEIARGKPLNTQYPMPGVRCLKFGKSHIYLQLSSKDFCAVLLKEYNCSSF